MTKPKHFISSIKQSMSDTINNVDKQKSSLSVIRDKKQSSLFKRMCSDTSCELLFGLTYILLLSFINKQNFILDYKNGNLTRQVITAFFSIHNCIA